MKGYLRTIFLKSVSNIYNTNNSRVIIMDYTGVVL